MYLSLCLFSVPACMASSSRSSSGWWVWMSSLRQFRPACSGNPVLAHGRGDMASLTWALSRLAIRAHWLLGSRLHAGSLVSVTRNRASPMTSPDAAVLGPKSLTRERAFEHWDGHREWSTAADTVIEASFRPHARDHF